MILRGLIVLLVVFAVACQQEPGTTIPTEAAGGDGSLQGDDVESAAEMGGGEGQLPDANTNDLGGDTETYTDTQAGYAFDYPAQWYMQGGEGSPAIVTSFEPVTDGTGGIDPAQTKIDFVPQAGSTDVATLAAAQATMITDQGGEILQEANYILANGTPATRIEYQTEAGAAQVVLVTTVGETPLLVAGYGNLVAFDEIVNTLRVAGTVDETE